MFKDAKRSDGTFAATVVSRGECNKSVTIRDGRESYSSNRLMKDTAAESTAQLTNQTVTVDTPVDEPKVGDVDSSRLSEPASLGSVPVSSHVDTVVVTSQAAPATSTVIPSVSAGENSSESDCKVHVTSPGVLSRPAETCTLAASTPATVTITMLSTSIVRGPNTVPPTSLVTTSTSASTTTMPVVTASTKTTLLPQLAMAARQTISQQSASPSPKGHVTFSDQITEFHPDEESGINSKSKRVPPAPPPRKVLIQLENGSRSGGSPSSGSPSASDKIYSILRKDRPSSAVEPSVTAFDDSCNHSQGPMVRPRSGRMNGFPSGRPLSVAPLATVDSDSDSSVSGVDVQQTGTIRRNAAVRVPDSLDAQSMPSPNGKATKDVFKIPPPVPVRKTSSLTTTSSNSNLVGIGSPTSDLYSNLQDMKLECALLESAAAAAAKYNVSKSVADVKGVNISSQNSSIMNLRCTDSSSGVHGSVKKCEETEIY